jgi:amino acid permease
MSLLSLHLLLEVHKRTGERNYLVFSEKSFGKIGKILILFINFVSAYGSCWTFIIICLKVIPNILTLSFGHKNFSSDIFISIILGIILFFFCYQQDITGIKKAAFYGVVGIIFFFGFTIADFLYSIYNEKGDNDLLLEKYIINNHYFETDDNEEVITAISIIILCYTYHSFTFSIYGCLGNITLKQFYTTATVSVSICTFIYLICGILGYLLYSDKIKDSILDGIGNGTLNSFLSLCNVANVIMTFPITFAAVKNYFLFIVEVVLTYLRNSFLFVFGCFSCVQKIKTNIQKKEKNDNKRFLGKSSSVSLPKYAELFLILGLYVSVFILANKYQELKIIFSILGGIMGNIFSFIFPALFYLCLGRKKNEIFSFNNIISGIFIIFGAITLITCSYSNLLSIFKKD